MDETTNQPAAEPAAEHVDDQAAASPTESATPEAEAAATPAEPVPELPAPEAAPGPEPDRGVRDTGDIEAPDMRWGVAGLTRGQIKHGGFSLWHIDLPGHTTSDALIADVLDPAIEYIQRGDVIFITCADGVLMRALALVGGKVKLFPVV